MFDYSSMAGISANLIANFGKTVTLRTETASGTVYNPTITQTDTNITAVITDYTLKEIDGTLVQSGDKQMITISAITTADKIVDDGVEYSITNIRQIKPSTTSLLYKATIRK